MLKQNLVRICKFGVLALIFGMPGVIGSIPSHRDLASVEPFGHEQSNVAIYQDLHEIKIEKQKYLDFDRDVQHLSAQEKRYRKPLPVQLSLPMNRIDKTPYR